MNVFISTKKILIRDLVICVLIIILPFAFYLYKLTPETTQWSFIGIELSSSYYDDIQSFFWALNTKLLTLIALVIWFITCKHWWRFSIMVPIFIEFYKLIGVINDNQNFFDEYEFITSLPLTIPIVILLIYLSKKLKYYSISDLMNNRIESDINNTIKQIIDLKYEQIRKAKEKYEQLKKDKPNMDKDEYLRQLIILKYELNNP